MDIVFRKDQKEIMKYKSGSMGIQAVPGAGKTFIITNLVAKLLKKMKKSCFRLQRYKLLKAIHNRFITNKVAVTVVSDYKDTNF